MRPLLELPDLPQNGSLLGFLRGQASPPKLGRADALGAWELHAHPDLMDRLCELAPAWTFAGGDWRVVDPWQGQLSSADGTRVLRGLVGGALSYAASPAGE